MNTRAMAAAILTRIKDHGAYSNVILPAATKDLSRPDRAFVYSLVTTALREIRKIDAIVAETTGRNLDELDPEVVGVLEIAVGEMLGDDGESVYATVNESVNAVKQLGKARASGLVNGVLRRLGREGLPELPNDKARDLSVPEWVLGKITHDHGKKMAGDLFEGLRCGSPRTGIRVRPGGRVPDDAIAVAGIDDAFLVSQLPDSAEKLVVTDAASSAVAQAVGMRAGEKVLDMAAAPGGKTIALWDQSGGTEYLVAMDAHGRRLRSSRDRLAALDVHPTWIHADGAQVPFADGVFDAVLLDAPCTGLGTLRRRPEIAMRLMPKSLESLAAKQRQLLAEAWRTTRPGGRIVYSVCTLFGDETVDIVADYPAHAPENLPGSIWGKGRLMAPHLTDTDGMFVSVIER